MANKRFLCLYCDSYFAVNSLSHRTYRTSFRMADESPFNEYSGMMIVVHYFVCPNCEKTSVNIKPMLDGKVLRTIPIVPLSGARKFPDFVPEIIREDYEEAYSILHLSPKASATLARRCLQTMIADFWGVKKKNLADSIRELEDEISPSLMIAIDGIRKIGNIGAHMEKDVNLIIDIEAHEAELLLELLETLIEDWYIKRYEHNLLQEKIKNIAEEKEAKRKNEEE